MKVARLALFYRAQGWATNKHAYMWSKRKDLMQIRRMSTAMQIHRWPQQKRIKNVMAWECAQKTCKNAFTKTFSRTKTRNEEEVQDKKDLEEIVERTYYGVDKEHNPKRRIVDKSVTQQTPHRREEAQLVLVIIHIPFRNFNVHKKISRNLGSNEPNTVETQKVMNLIQQNKVEPYPASINSGSE